MDPRRAGSQVIVRAFVRVHVQVDRIWSGFKAVYIYMYICTHAHIYTYIHEYIYIYIKGNILGCPEPTEVHKYGRLWDLVA